MAKQSNTNKPSLSDLKSKIEKHETPLQKVVPVKSEKSDNDEVLLNAYVPRSLRESLKVKAARERIPMKELLVEALRGYFKDLD